MSTRYLAGLTFFLSLVVPVAPAGQNPAAAVTDTTTPALNNAGSKPKKIWTNDDLRGAGAVPWWATSETRIIT